MRSFEAALMQLDPVSSETQRCAQETMDSALLKILAHVVFDGGGWKLCFQGFTPGTNYNGLSQRTSCWLF